jgi:hypothetical protein
MEEEKRLNHFGEIKITLSPSRRSRMFSFSPIVKDRLSLRRLDGSPRLCRASFLWE